MIRSLSQIIKNQGLGYFLFRAQYELKRRSGLFKFSYPTSFPVSNYPSFSQWKQSTVQFVVKEREKVTIPVNRNDSLKYAYERIKKGDVLYFNKEWVHNDNWFFNPSSSYTYDSKIHWSEIEDLSTKAGDIKYVWEKSRFTFLFDIIRYDYHFDENSAEFVFDIILDWIKENKPNLGPNYKCSQEISLRCLNWIFAIYFYKNSPSITEDKWEKIIQSLEVQIQHVFNNIHFSRVCVRNNHAITECLFLFIAGTLFPFLTNAKKWKRKGKEWLENELLYQIYEDGTYLQFSHNYQRVVVQLLTYYLSFSSNNDIVVSNDIKKRISELLHYMVSVCIGDAGETPNYGSNDGALFFNLSNCDYTDYRPQLNGLSYALNNTFIYAEDELKEEALWITNVDEMASTSQILKEGISTFPEGGVYLIKDMTSFSFFKCIAYKDRPAHADNMHLDIWINGKNYLRDSGTYTYNTTKENIHYFSGTKGHNTIILSDTNQMEKASRFIWFDWTKIAECEVYDTNEEWVLKASAVMFPEIGPNIKHIREIRKIKGENTWCIEDKIINKPPHIVMKQLWHPHPDYISSIFIESRDQHTVLVENKDIGYWSPYYGVKEEVPLIYYETKESSIYTKIRIAE